jgi:hypothetical protein
MRLSRTSFAFDEIKQFVDEASTNPLVESCLVQYLLVAFYSEVEERIKEIISSRISDIQDRKVAAFVFKTNEGMLKRVKKAEINDVLQKFDCGEGDIITGLVGDMNLQPYFDAITNRHLVSHQSGTTMTLTRFGEALACAEKILDTVEIALGPDLN